MMGSGMSERQLFLWLEKGIDQTVNDQLTGVIMRLLDLVSCLRLMLVLWCHASCDVCHHYIQPHDSEDSQYYPEII